MRQPLRVGLVLAALAAVALAATHLSPAAKGSVTRAEVTSGDVYAYRFDDILTLTGSSASPNNVITTTTLPAGSYVITAKLVAFGGRRTYSRVVCSVELGVSTFPPPPGSLVDNTSTTVGIKRGASEDQSVSLLLAGTLTSPARARLDCWPEETTGPLPSVTEASLVVFPVSSISG